MSYLPTHTHADILARARVLGQKLSWGKDGRDGCIQRPQATIIVQSHLDGLVLFIMMLDGISAATYHGKKTASATL